MKYSALQTVTEQSLNDITGKTGHELVEHLYAWVAAVDELGFLDAFKHTNGGAMTPVLVAETPASEATLAEVEATLGYSLPPSFRRFLSEFGAIEFPGRAVRTIPAARCARQKS